MYGTQWHKIDPKLGFSSSDMYNNFVASNWDAFYVKEPFMGLYLYFDKHKREFSRGNYEDFRYVYDSCNLADWKDMAYDINYDYFTPPQYLNSFNENSEGVLTEYIPKVIANGIYYDKYVSIPDYNKLAWPIGYLEQQSYENEISFIKKDNDENFVWGERSLKLSLPNLGQACVRKNATITFDYICTSACNLYLNGILIPEGSNLEREPIQDFTYLNKAKYTLTIHSDDFLSLGINTIEGMNIKIVGQIADNEKMVCHTVQVGDLNVEGVGLFPLCNIGKYQKQYQKPNPECWCAGPDTPRQPRTEWTLLTEKNQFCCVDGRVVDDWSDCNELDIGPFLPEYFSKIPEDCIGKMHGEKTCSLDKTNVFRCLYNENSNEVVISQDKDCNDLETCYDSSFGVNCINAGLLQKCENPEYDQSCWVICPDEGYHLDSHITCPSFLGLVPVLIDCSQIPSILECTGECVTVTNLDGKVTETC